MNKNNIISNKDTKSKSNISFFENIIYWLWHYSMKNRVRFPWSVAQAIVSTLKFFNLSFAVFVVLNLINIFHVNYWNLIVLFPIIWTFDMIVYKSQKYCIEKNKQGEIWDEKYCILDDKYNNISPKERKEHKNTFFIYLFITIITSVILILSAG
jgi:hypothetical protein